MKSRLLCQVGILTTPSFSVPQEITGSTGTINRLKPGDRVRVHVGVVNKAGTDPGSAGTATAEITGSSANASYSFNATFGIAPYEADYASIYSHETPPWYNGAKYGIFIHWVRVAVRENRSQA